MQKLMFKGLVKDETKTLKDLKLAKNSKMMLVGTTMSDIVAVNTKPSTSEINAGTSSAATKREPLCKQKMHIKVLEKGKPEDAMQGIKGAKHSLPNTPIGGMVNKTGGKVRLTFKLAEDSLWIGTKARTEKVNMSSIRTVVSEVIEDNPEYHILGIQLGPTELSMYWIYWVPAQYVDATATFLVAPCLHVLKGSPNPLERCSRSDHALEICSWFGEMESVNGPSSNVIRTTG
eukprot:sb/3469388/